MTERKKLALKEDATRKVRPEARASRKTVSAKPQAAVAPDKALKPVMDKSPRQKKVPLQAIVQRAVSTFEDRAEEAEHYGGGGKFTARSQRTRKMSKADKCYWTMRAVRELNRQSAQLRAGR